MPRGISFFQIIEIAALLIVGAVFFAMVRHTPTVMIALLVVVVAIVYVLVRRNRA